MKMCPFCGHYQMAVTFICLDAYAVMCRQCGARGPEASTHLIAIELWDARFDVWPTPPPHPADPA